MAEAKPVVKTNPSVITISLSRGARTDKGEAVARETSFVLVNGSFQEFDRIALAITETLNKIEWDRKDHQPIETKDEQQGA